MLYRIIPEAAASLKQSGTGCLGDGNDLKGDLLPLLRDYEPHALLAHFLYGISETGELLRSNRSLASKIDTPGGIG